MTARSIARRASVGLAVALAASGLTVAGITPAYAAGCTSTVPGDVNGDGHAEVAVSEYGYGGEHRGAVHVFYGKTSGLTAEKSGTALDDQYFDQAVPGVPGDGDDEALFGDSTTFGDFNADGCADLAVSSPGGEDDDDEAAVVVLYGSRSGLTTQGAQRLTMASLGRPAADLAGDLVSADLDDDGVADLAVGQAGMTVGGVELAGGVTVVYGDASGLGRGSTAADVVTRDTPGVPGAPRTLDYFGSPLAAGDFNDDGVAELAVGVTGVGGVQTLQRGTSGYGGPQPALITHATPGVPSSPEALDNEWAFSLAAGDLNGDGRDDLAVGDPNEGCLECDEEYGFGSVTVLPGSADGLTGTGSTLWTQGSPGVQGDKRPDDGFGYSLAIGPLDGDGIDDLAIGTPSDEGYVGSVTLLLGSTGGPTTAGAGGTLYDQATPGIAGRPGPNSFGASLTTAFVQRSDQASLVIGARGEKIGRLDGTGRIVQLSLQKSGPKASTSRSLHLDSPGVKGKPSKYAQFGFELS